MTAQPEPEDDGGAFLTLEDIIKGNSFPSANEEQQNFGKTQGVNDMTLLDNLVQEKLFGQGQEPPPEEEEEKQPEPVNLLDGPAETPAEPEVAKVPEPPQTTP